MHSSGTQQITELSAAHPMVLTVAKESYDQDTYLVRPKFPELFTAYPMVRMMGSTRCMTMVRCTSTKMRSGVSAFPKTIFPFCRREARWRRTRTQLRKRRLAGRYVYILFQNSNSSEDHNITTHIPRLRSDFLPQATGNTSTHLSSFCVVSQAKSS